MRISNQSCGDSQLFAIYSDKRNLSPKVRAFIDFLVHAFADKGPDLW